MTRDYEPIRPQAETAGNGRVILIGILVALLAGLIAGGWLVTHFFGGEQPAVATAAGASGDTPALDAQGAIDDVLARQAAPAPIVAPGAPAPDAGATSVREVALAQRVADLEDRLSRITVAAQAASGNAARAEGLLVAFAARRIIDKGIPLGYIEGQLRLRFGDAQPRAVSTIIDAANQPVTIEDLRAELNDLSGALITGSETGGFWANVQRELSGLFVVREEGAPSPAPARRLDRARRYLDGGNVDAAIEEVQAMPGRDAAAAWLIEARRYAEVRRALDLIETAAILEPLRGGDIAPGVVEQVTQPAPQQAAPAAAPPTR